MGRHAAMDMLNHASLDQALAWHFASNCYPPIPHILIPAAKRAIAKANRGDFNANIRLPAGVSWRGKSLAPVSACIEGWYLGVFISNDFD